MTDEELAAAVKAAGDALAEAGICPLCDGAGRPGGCLLCTRDRG